MMARSPRSVRPLWRLGRLSMSSSSRSRRTKSDRRSSWPPRSRREESCPHPHPLPSTSERGCHRPPHRRSDPCCRRFQPLQRPPPSPIRERPRHPKDADQSPSLAMKPPSGRRPVKGGADHLSRMRGWSPHRPRKRRPIPGWPWMNRGGEQRCNPIAQAPVQLSPQRGDGVDHLVGKRCS